MTCENCKSELKPTTVFRYVDEKLEMQPGYECHRCGAIYSADGTRLDNLDATEDEKREDA